MAQEWTVMIKTVESVEGGLRITADVLDENGRTVLQGAQRTFPADISGEGVIQSFRHEAWMRKYPNAPRQQAIVPGTYKR